MNHLFVAPGQRDLFDHHRVSGELLGENVDQYFFFFRFGLDGDREVTGSGIKDHGRDSTHGDIRHVQRNHPGEASAHSGASHDQFSTTLGDANEIGGSIPKAELHFIEAKNRDLFSGFIALLKGEVSAESLTANLKSQVGSGGPDKGAGLELKLLGDVIDLEGLIYCGSRLVDLKIQDSREFESGQIGGDINSEATSQSIPVRVRAADQDEVAFTIAEADKVTVAVTQSKFDISGGNPDSGRIIGRILQIGSAIKDQLFEDEVTQETLTGNDESNVRSFEADVWTGGQFKCLSRSTDGEVFVDRQGRSIDLKCETPFQAEGIGRQDLDGGRNLSGKPSSGDEEEPRAISQPESGVFRSQKNVHIGRGDLDDVLSIFSGDLLEGEVPFQTLPQHFNDRVCDIQSHGIGSHSQLGGSGGVELKVDQSLQGDSVDVQNRFNSSHHSRNSSGQEEELSGSNIHANNGSLFRSSKSKAEVGHLDAESLLT